MKIFHGEPRLDASLNAKMIPGWMTTNECQWLVQQAMSAPLILEIGSYAGRSTKAMALGHEVADLAGGTVVTFDDWRGEKDTGIGGEELQAMFAENLKSEIESGAVCSFSKDIKVLNQKDRVLVVPVNGVPTDIVHDMFDMIFIDASHDKRSVARDCKIAQKYIKSDGLVCGHDWFMPSVQAGVREVFSRARQVSGSIWTAGQ